ncbi:MAG: hypothetical protein JWN14_2606 [Chthonomonadales bacterium]|nr:hypothetical protein [Chthonomonadales bacterium]
MRISKRNVDINSVQNWFDYAGPKQGLQQWVDGRSAKELAKLFLKSGTPAEPPEIKRLLRSSDFLGEVCLIEGWPEHKIRLDSFRGETRNADMAALGVGRMLPVAVTIEAKADESFGRTIGEVLARASTKSNLPGRITGLVDSVLNKPLGDTHSLRYQLLHAVSATLIFAREQNASAAVFIVFEFQGSSCTASKLAQNAADLTAFINALAPSAPPLREGELLGPFYVPGGDHVPSNIPLFLGKAIRKC